MDEVFKYQESITDSLERANDKYDEIERLNHIEQTISRTKEYQEKVVNLRRSLTTIKDKSARLRRKAHKILEWKNKEDLEQQRTRERREALERHLEPVVNTRPDL